MRTLFALTLSAPMILGCGGAIYQPRPSPRIQIVQDSGISLVKNGKMYAIGVLGGDLEEIVQGSPRAEEEARSFRSKTIAGFALGLGGSLAAGAGAGIIAFNEANARGSDLRIAGLSLAIGGVVLALASAAIQASAPKHLWNAINIYNDDLPPPYGFGPPRVMPGVPQPAYAPQGYPQPGYAPPAYAPPAYAPPAYAPPAPLPPSAPPAFAPPGPLPPSAPPPPAPQR